MKTKIAMMALVLGCAAGTCFADSTVRFTKPDRRWLWGGLGFHNQEATMLPIMTDEFRDERAVKTFREISPTYSRVFAVMVDSTREALDSFADYYDLTFRKAGTTLYVTPARFPYIDRDFDATNHFERIARHCDYLMRERNLNKIRYFTVANELHCDHEYLWFWTTKWPEVRTPDPVRTRLYRDYCELMYLAFKRHGLDIGLCATDGATELACDDEMRWAIENVNEFVDTYCVHFYCFNDAEPGDLSNYDYVHTNLAKAVELAYRREKRCSLGEFGYIGGPALSRPGAMREDCGYAWRDPSKEHLAAISYVEMAFAAINAGMVEAARWTMCDYPDPMLRENGDTDDEKKAYQVARFSGSGVTTRYNKHGMFRWCEDEHDYSARADLYAYGYAAKLFRKGGRILPSESDDATLRTCGITFADGSATIGLINWGGPKTVKIDCVCHRMTKKLRVYRYDSASVPYNDFNDLQPFDGTVEQAADGTIAVDLPARSIAYLTSDYVDRVPAAVGGLRMVGGRLRWTASDEPEHVYYRLYRNGKQIASTVATSRPADGSLEEYRVTSVDKWGNEGN